MIKTWSGPGSLAILGSSFDWSAKIGQNDQFLAKIGQIDNFVNFWPAWTEAGISVLGTHKFLKFF